MNCSLNVKYVALTASVSHGYCSHNSKYWRALSPTPQTQGSHGFLGRVESITVDPVYLFASMAAACCVCVPVFHFWQPGVLKWVLAIY